MEAKDILRDTDVLGQEKPTNQMSKVRKMRRTWLVLLILALLAIVAIILEVGT